MEFWSLLKRSLQADFLSPAGYFFVVYVCIFFVVARCMNQKKASQNENASMSFLDSVKEGSWLSFTNNPSLRLDLQLLIFNHYLIFILISFALGSFSLENLVTTHVSHQAIHIGKFKLPNSNGFWVDLIYTALVLFFADLGWTIQHILFHRVPWLWEFHKVHHSAPSLNIFTIARLHPIDALSQGWASAVTVGIFAGLTKCIFGFSPSMMTVMGVSVAMAAFRIFGIFRHSHLWITFGPKLSRIFCSPAMHQIHHGMDEAHWDKNFSTVFAVWDLVFGTLYVPIHPENVRFGIPQNPGRNYNTFWGCLLHPFATRISPDAKPAFIPDKKN